MGLGGYSASYLIMDKWAFRPSVWSAKALSRAINHILSKESWARAELMRHAGKQIKLSLPVTQVAFMIDDAGYVQALDATVDLDNCNLTLSISPSVLAEVLATQGELREKPLKPSK